MNDPFSRHLDKEPIVKANGVTPTEQFLGKLCEKTFLSLWSYPGIYRDSGSGHNQGHGKEVCDLLVLFENHVLIFSDKNCEFKRIGNIDLNWQRWFRRAVEDSAQQAWGAERWIKKFPDRLFLDRACTKSLPIDFPKDSPLNFHLIIVAHGISTHIKELYGGNGSLIIDSSLVRLGNHTIPFTIGDLDPNQSFVHILDDYSLITLMNARDTISDFVKYLEKKEKLIRSHPAVLAAGEEELLAVYLKNLNDKNEHDFIFHLKEDSSPDKIIVPEGFWNEFTQSSQRRAQIEEDKISYMWDDLIETFNKHTLEGTQYFVSDGGFKDSEFIVRFMARENRFKRRCLAHDLKEILETTPSDKRGLRVTCPEKPDDTYWVFLLVPLTGSFQSNYEKYRKIRLKYMEDCCMVVKQKWPDARNIVGIATESGADIKERSEDAFYLDGSRWNEDLEREAKGLQEKLGILKAPKEIRHRILEYPEEGD